MYDGQQLNKEYLHLLTTDTLLYSFRVTAGLNNTEPDVVMGGWEAPTSQLRGHFVGMYLSASAKAYSSYGDVEQKEKADYMVAQFALCQQALGGYLSAFPSSEFDLLENLQNVWVPYYTVHKIFEGLWDMYTVTGNEQAYDIVIGMAAYFTARIRNVIAKYSIYRWQQILQVEFGGMNDIMYQVYSVTNVSDHLWMAQMFDSGFFLGPLELGQDMLTTLHANMHIPQVLGAAHRYEIVGDSVGRTISENFYDFVVGNRSYATGGHNGGNGTNDAYDEHWGDPGRLAATLTDNNQEFCTTYNTLKLATHLIQWTTDVQYMDFYERAYFNGILGTQNPLAGPGFMIYNYPLGTGFNKAQSYMGWGTPYTTFFCCQSTAIEQWAKMGEAIYFKSGDDTQLYVNLYVASTLNWTSNNVVINQTTNFPIEQGAQFEILTSSSSPVDFTLNLHIPYWVGSGAQITVNGGVVGSSLTPSSLFPIQRTWKNGDIVNITLPMYPHLHAMPDDPMLAAVMYGPLVLGGLTNVTHTLPINQSSELPAIMKPVSGMPNQFIVSVDDGNALMTMQPLYTLVEEHYGVYWRLTG